MRSVTQLSNIHTGTGTHMLHIAEVADVIVGIFYGGIVYQFVVLFHLDLSHLYISLLQNTFLIGTAAFMLLGLEIFPLGLHFSVQFQFRIAFGIVESQLLISRNKIRE